MKQNDDLTAALVNLACLEDCATGDYVHLTDMVRDIRVNLMQKYGVSATDLAVLMRNLRKWEDEKREKI